MNLTMRFIRVSGIYFVGSVLSKAVVFLLLPIYTKYIAPADYGYYDLSITYSELVISVLFLDVWISVMRYMYENSNIQDKYNVILSGSSIFGLSTILYCIVTATIIFLNDIQYVGYIFLFGFSNNIQNLYTYAARGFGKNIDFVVSGIINSLIAVVMNIILIIAMHRDFSSLYIAAIIGNLFQIMFLEYKIQLFRNIKLKNYNWALTIKMFKYTLPLCFNSLAYWLLTSYNRIVINQVFSISYNGYYAIGNKFTTVIGLITTCFTSAWQEISFSRSVDDPQNGKFYSNVCKQYLQFLGSCLIILTPAIYIIFPVMVDKTYEMAKETIPLFLMVSVTAAYSTFIGNIFYALKNTKSIFISMVISCLLNLIINRPLIHLWGLNGANISIFFSFLLNIIIRNIILKKQIGFYSDYKTVIKIAFSLGVNMAIYVFCGLLANIMCFIFSGIVVLYLFRNTVKSLQLRFLQVKDRYE